MSDDTEGAGFPLQSGDSVIENLEDWYHVPALVVILAFMFWVRVRNWRAFTRGGEVLFSGNDAWYHYRQVVYTVRHYPRVMPFDPWTGYPTGISVGQFGTLFDQLIATAALIVGLGSPSQHTIALTVLFAPPVFGTLVAIPTYFIGKRLGGRFAGFTAALVLALIPGLFLQRSLVGAADHNIAEPLFQSTAVVLTMVALSAATRERPVWEQVADRDFEALRDVLGWSALAGVATALYLWIWPPGVLLLGILAAFYTVRLAGDHLRGTSPDHVAFVGVVSMLVTALLSFVPLSVPAFSAVQPSLLQPALAALVAAGCAFLAWLARAWDARGVERRYYPVAVAALLVGGVLLVRLVSPSTYGFFAHQVVRFIGFSTGAQTRTISEAQPFLSRAQYLGVSRVGIIAIEYGLTFFTAVLAAAVMLWEPLFRSANPRRVAFAAVAVVVSFGIAIFQGVLPALGAAIGFDPTIVGLLLVGGLLAVSLVLTERSASEVLVLTWGIFLVAAAFTQVRFNYYLAVPVAAFNGYLVYRVVDLWEPADASERAEDLDWSQVFAVAMVFLIIIVPFTGIFQVGGATVPSPAAVGGSASPGGITGWDPMLDWMSNHTPAEGNYGGAGNADQLDYYGTYHKPADGDFDYPDGAYGVLSWWDYGHWITVEGHRIPVANPFQQHATHAANVLLAPNESVATQRMESFGGPGETTRYVAVDWQMASVYSKFGAPVIFYNESQLSIYDFRTAPVLQSQNGQLSYYGRNQVTYIHKQRYYDSFMVRLFRYHGSAMEPQPVVVDWDRWYQPPGSGVRYPLFTPDGQNDSLYLTNFSSMEAARAYVRNDSTAQIGGVGRYPTEYVPALQHYRLVGLSTQPLGFDQVMSGSRFSNVPVWAKTFERVPGATVHGTAPPNTTVTASVTMYSTQLGRNSTFTYTQRARTGPDGEFTMVLPYSTTGYENWGTAKGYTNVSVRATGPYTFTTPATTNASTGEQVVWGATAHVPEAHVIGENDSAIQVSLERRVVDRMEGANATAGNGTGGNATGGNATSGTGGNATGGNASAGANASASLAAPDAVARPRAARDAVVA